MTVGLEGAFRSSPRKNGDTPLPGLTKTQMDKHAKMRLVHCLVHEETRKLLEDSGLAATRLQLDSKWNNMQAMWTQIKDLFHDANFNPQLDTHLLQGYVLPTYKMPDPGFLGYVIAESSLVRTVKDMKHIKTEVCRKLPSGTNAQGWNDIFEKCTSERDGGKPCLEVFYLLRLLQDRNLEDVDLRFTNLVDESLQHEHQMFGMDKPDTSVRKLAHEMTDAGESSVLSLSLSLSLSA